MRHQIVLIIAAALVGCAATKPPGDFARTQPHSYRLPGWVDHDGSHRVIDIGRAMSLRFFRILRTVECNQYVYTEPPIYDADTVRNIPGRMDVVKNAIEKCGEVFADWFESGDARVMDADAVLYEPETYRVVQPPLLSGATGLFMASSGAYLKGWAIKYVENPSEEEIRDVIVEFQHRYRGRSPAPKSYWEIGIRRIAQRQLAAALSWLNLNGHSLKWDWIGEVRKILPEDEWKGNDDRFVIGEDPAKRAAVNLLAAHGAERYPDLWLKILKAAERSWLYHGGILVAAGNVVACSPNLYPTEQLLKIHSGQMKRPNSAFDLTMARIIATRKKSDITGPDRFVYFEPGVTPYACPYTPTSFNDHAH